MKLLGVWVWGQLFFTFFTCLFAQEKWIDVIYLKNGGVVRGTIVEQIGGKTVKVQQKDGNFLIFNWEEIDRIVKENEKVNNLPSLSSHPTLLATDSSLRPKRFFTAPFLAFNSLQITSARVDNQFGYDLGFLMGYRFHTNWSIQSGLIVSNSGEKFERGQYRFILVTPPPIDSTYTIVLEKYQTRRGYTFLNFPLLFRYHSEKANEKVGFFLDLGTRLGFLFYKQKEYHNNLIIQDAQNIGLNWDFIMLGLGLKVPIIRDLGLYIGPHYSVGMARIANKLEITQNLGVKLGTIYFF